ncbi:MAG: 3-deoxy-manno-octulosonate cytidylyltransferase [Proteobacteria bacterium]|nr:3-deoxy-manno-octulosonate cytidylyltransferase [Pseudomonadota bacterium]
MVKAAQVIGIIPARAHSTRFPFKILFPILGKPMIQYVWELARRSKSLTEVIIATDHIEIFNTVKSFGAKVVMTPSELASGSDRVAFVAKDHAADIIVNLQGDEPLLNPIFIDSLVKSLIMHSESEISTLAVRKTDPQELANPNCVKVVFDSKNKALYFSRSPLASHSSGEFFKHMGVYAYRRDTLLKFCQLPVGTLEKVERLEQLRALENGMGIQVCVVDQDTVAVDVPEDIIKVEDILKKIK